MRLAEAHGCELEVANNGRIYLHAPDGKMFRSCQSETISYGGSILPARPTRNDWIAAHHFFKSEINEGFENQ